VPELNGKSFFKLKTYIEDKLGYSFFCGTLNSSSLVPQRRKRLYIVCFRKKNTKFSFPELLGSELPLSLILQQSVDDQYTISDKLWTGHRNRTSRNLARDVHFTAFTAALDKPANTLVSRYGKDGKECLIPQDGKNPRLLTPRECARLQGFPDHFLLADYNTRAYRQFGNAVVVPMVEVIGKRFFKKNPLMN
jgi:DNA (cytosine-5)-methyltransferase 1